MSDSTSWIIKRNCSAGPRELALVFGSLVALSFVISAAFAAFGLWLILPFVGVEALAVAAAFFVYGRRAADYERIEIADGQVCVERLDGSRRTFRKLPAAWIRVEVQRRGEVSVWLACSENRVEVGRHLREPRRLRLAEEINSVLRGAWHATGATRIVNSSAGI